MAFDSSEADKSVKTKQIFVTGGVVSSLGKGLTASALGMLLRRRGLKVVMQKLDPYINVDPGTMNPYEHGEVFVTRDGSEADLDIGHYERFLDVELSGDANATTGKVYSEVLARERRGDYHGQTVQVIPHITNEIMRRMRAQAHPEDGSVPPDVIITEIGGTVGDIESTPFLEAARQVRRELGRDNCLFLHVSLLPYLASAGELKTKPTQHSVSLLRSIGIQPDVLVLRSEVDVPDSARKKVALMCDVESNAVIVCPDADSLYEVPKILHREGLDVVVVRKLDLPFHDVNWQDWDELLRRVSSPAREVEIAVVGKYVELPDAYLSASEALRAGGFANDARVNVRWVSPENCETGEDCAQALAGVDGILVPGGFGRRGVEGLLTALNWARTNSIPTLGLSLGAQGMLIEAARNLLGKPGANSIEFDEETDYPVLVPGEITAADEQEMTTHKRGMRIGTFPADLAPGSHVARIYGEDSVQERHRHRYEINAGFEDDFASAGIRFSGRSPQGDLVEFIELDEDDHPYYVGTQAHPEFKSRPTRPHPLFTSFVAAALQHQALEHQEDAADQKEQDR